MLEQSLTAPTICQMKDLPFPVAFITSGREPVVPHGRAGVSCLIRAVLGLRVAAWRASLLRATPLDRTVCEAALRMRLEEV